MKKFALRTAALAASLLLSSVAAHAQTADPVVLTFSTVGDSRQDLASPDGTQLPLSGQDAHWLQNSKAWSRIMREVTAKKANLLFFNGDMIMGYGNASVPSSVTDVNSVVNSDLGKFYAQYAFWRGMVAPLIEAGTYVVPVPGNHEVQCKSVAKTSTSATTGITTPVVVCGTLDANGKDTLASVNGGKNAIKVNEDAWRANMGDLILDQTRLNANLPTGVTASNVDTTDHAAADGLSTAQNQLSYSFDVGGSHFAIVNTDAVGFDSHAPVGWLAADLAAAQVRGAQHFFVFGHKPAYTYYYAGYAGAPTATAAATKWSGLDTNPDNQKTFWDLIEQYGATYFSGHEHIFNAQQPRASTGGTAWQVLVGSGGSPFDASNASQTGLLPTDRTYAYANVRVFQSGKVVIDAYGFSDTYGPTQKLTTITLAH
jgi:hypothetical protein